MFRTVQLFACVACVVTVCLTAGALRAATMIYDDFDEASQTLDSTKWTILDSTNTTFYVNDPTAPSQLLPYDTGYGSGWIRSTGTWSGNTDFAFKFPSNSDTFSGGMAIHLGITNAANGPAGCAC